MQAKIFGGFVLVTLLAACGGGGGGGSVGSSTSNTLSGVAAVGAPISNALIKLTCSDGSVKTTTANSAGEYSFAASDLASCTAPYVVSATGQVGDTQETFVSVLPTQISGSQTLNVTPLTHALSATLSSTGDPLKLVDDFVNEKSAVSATAVTQRSSAITAALSNVLTAAGLPADFDLLQGKFTADSTGFDKVLDNVKVDVKAGGVDIVNTGAAVHDDMGSLSSAPASNFASSGISINKNTNFSSALTTLPSQIQDTSIADLFQTQLNNCFATASTARGSVGALTGSCSVLQIASDYLNDGKNGASEFNFRLQGGTYDNAVFGKPEVIRFLSATPTDTRALIAIGLTRTDGVTETIQTVVEMSAANTGGVLKLRGNQRPFYFDIAGVVQKREQLVQRNTTTNARSTYYGTSIQFYLDYNTGNAHNAIGYVKVTGPLLPVGGIYLRKDAAGCTQYFTIWIDAETTSPSICSALYQLNSRAATTSDTDNWATLFGVNQNFAPSKLSDADILAIQPGTAYKIEVVLASNTVRPAVPDYTFYQRLRSRPYTMGDVATQSGEIDKVKWSDGLQQSTITAITPDSNAVAGSTVPSLNISYVRTPNAAPPFKVMVQTKNTTASGLQVNSMFLPISPTYVAGDVISKDMTGPNGGTWQNQKATVAQSGAINLVQMVSRNRFGTMVLRDWKY